MDTHEAPTTTDVRTPEPRPLIVLENVTKSFDGVEVLHGVDLTVHAGEVVVIIGPSGSGKSTLCRTINRLEVIDSGSITIGGEPQPSGGEQLARMRADVGMVFQHFNLFDHLSVLENLTLGPTRVRQLSVNEAQQRARTLLDRVGLAGVENKRPSQLSGGQQQRVAIARSLAMQPKAMLFDEPTSALDPEMIGEVLQVMEDLAAQGMTMVIVTHEMGFARQVADRIVFMADGRILEDTSPEVFFTQPATQRARDFIASIHRG